MFFFKHSSDSQIGSNGLDAAHQNLPEAPQLAIAEHIVPLFFSANTAGWGLSFRSIGPKEKLPNTKITVLAPLAADASDEIADYRSIGSFDQETRNGLFGYIGGAGIANIVSEEAYSEAAQPPEVIDALYSSDPELQTSCGRNLWHRKFVSARLDLNFPAMQALIDKYSPHLMQCSAENMIHWQSFIFADLAGALIDGLHQRGVAQFHYSHDPIPPKLAEWDWGKRYLKTLSKMDRVYLLSDEFRRRLVANLEALELPQPKQGIELMNLGINLTWINEALQQHPVETFEAGSLTERQRLFVAELERGRSLRSSSTQHPRQQFLCLDRMVPFKGHVNLFRAIDQFLTISVQQGLSGEQVQDRYRFFFIDDSATYLKRLSGNIYGQYARCVAQEMDLVSKKWPGVFHFCEPFRAQSRAILPSLMLGCHALSGTITEGLNMSVMEIAYANACAKQPCGVVVGAGAGFSQCVKDHGNQHLGFFPKTGVDLNPTVQALTELSRLRETNPNKLADMLQELSRREIESRQGHCLAGYQFDLNRL